jgi:hypothetical protein
MLPGRDYGDCRATLYPMMRALKHILLEKRKEKLVRLKETKESTQLIRIQNIDLSPLGKNHGSIIISKQIFAFKAAQKKIVLSCVSSEEKRACLRFLMQNSLFVIP